MTVFGLVRSAVGNDESARSKYLGPTGKRSAGKLACSVWSGGKAVRPYLSLLRLSRAALAAAERQGVGPPHSRAVSDTGSLKCYNSAQHNPLSAQSLYPRNQAP